MEKFDAASTSISPDDDARIVPALGVDDGPQFTLTLSSESPSMLASAITSASDADPTQQDG